MESLKAKIIRDLRWIGIAEGISFLVLLLIAMPMKYIYGNAMPVKVVGWVHGGLFVVYLLAVLRATLTLNWNYKRAGLFMAASFLPLGPFFLDGRLSREQEQY